MIMAWLSGHGPRSADPEAAERLALIRQVKKHLPYGVWLRAWRRRETRRV
jgi:hypothetical protein